MDCGGDCVRVDCVHVCVAGAAQVVATNIAETSITIEEVTHVVDAGRVKEMAYNTKKRMAQLTEVWCSQASARQRRGRAGRTCAGVCYKLYPLPSLPTSYGTSVAAICLSVCLLAVTPG